MSLTQLNSSTPGVTAENFAEKQLAATSIKSAEIALKESEEFTDGLMENAPNPILVINLDFSIRYANQATVNLTGFTLEEIIGAKPPYPWWPLEKSQDYSVVNTNIQKQISLGQERCYRNKSGDIFWVVINSKTISENGQAKYYLSNWVDITERKNAVAGLLLANQVGGSPPHTWVIHTYAGENPTYSQFTPTHVGNTTQ